MDARETLVAAAREKGTSLAALSRMIGRNATYLQQYIAKGSPRKLEEQDRRKLAQFLALDEAQLGAPKDNSYRRKSSGDWVDVPRLAVDVSAGPGASTAEELPFDAFRFSRRWLAEQGLEGAALSSIRVVGDSMEPLLRDGDEVVVHRRDRPFRDGIHVVRFDDTLLVKRVAGQGAGRFKLVSENTVYPPVDVAADEFAIVGRVVWKSGRV
ncbi:MAG: S24 family peptidase [Alteraurantiacibacter sp.]